MVNRSTGWHGSVAGCVVLGAVVGLVPFAITNGSDASASDWLEIIAAVGVGTGSAVLLKRVLTARTPPRAPAARTPRPEAAPAGRSRR